jgi:hypothetical protein
MEFLSILIYNPTNAKSKKQHKIWVGLRAARPAAGVFDCHGHHDFTRRLQKQLRARQTNFGAIGGDLYRWGGLANAV